MREDLPKDGFQCIRCVQKTVYFRANVQELQNPNDGSPPVEEGIEDGDGEEGIEDGDGEEGIEEAEDTRA